MNREEFLETLHMQLQGEIPSPEISQHLTYYNNFIDQKLRQGQSETEILEKLGDPRLIAKTLIDTEDVPNVHGYQQSYAYSAEESETDGFIQEDNDPDHFQQETTFSGSTHRLDPTTRHGKLAAAAGTLLLLILIFFVLRALLPVVALLIVIGMIISLINRRR